MPTTSASRPIELSELLCFDLYAASRAVTAIYRPLLTDLGLTYPQYLVLIVLRRERSSTVKQLSEALHLDYGTLTPLLRRMETKGLLTRQRRTDDERSVAIDLTVAGTALRSRTGDIQHAIQAAVGLNGQQTTALQSTLRAITASAAAQADAGRVTGGADPADSSSPR